LNKVFGICIESNFVPMKFIYYFLLITIFSFACSTPGENYANDVCSCLKESGLKNVLNPRDFAGNFNSTNSCIDEIGEEIYEILKGMSNSQRATFIKDFSREFLDTDCADIAFNLLPYDEMIKQMGRKYEKSSKKGFEFFSDEPSICDCVEIDLNTNKEMRKKCKEMEEVWRERYENGNEKDKDGMIREIQECERMKDSQK